MSPTLDDIRRAELWADSPVLGLLGPLPVLGDQVEGLRAVTDRLDRLADAGDRALRQVDGGLAAAAEPGGRVRLLSTAVDAVDDIERQVVASPPIDDDRLVGPLRTAVTRLERELDRLPARFTELRGHLRTAHDLLEGPTRVLLVAGNNAEMRAGMGMHLSAGVITIDDGDFTSSPFVPTGRLTDVTEGRATVPPELDALFGGIWDFGHEWRTTSTTPGFPTVGSVLADLAERSPIGEVDLVVSMDVPAVAMLLDATGPVRVGRDTVSSDNAVDLLLRENYLRLGEVSEAAERRDLQSRIAERIFETVTERDLDVIDLARELTRAADGRHLMGWSSDPDVQALWESMGADGSLTPRSFLVAAQNATASKRDFYLDPEVTVLPVDGAPDGAQRYQATLSLENPVVSPTAPYVDSLNRFVPKGVHRAYVSFTLPGAVRQVDIVRGTASRIGTDGPTVMATVWIRVPEDERRSATVEFTLPSDVRTVELVPGARVRPTRYRFGPVTTSDAVPRTVRLPEFAEVRVQEPQPFAVAALVMAFAGLASMVARSRRLGHEAPDRAAARTDARLAGAGFAMAVGFAVLAALV